MHSFFCIFWDGRKGGDTAPLAPPLDPPLPPLQLVPSYYRPSTSYYIESANQEWWKSAPPFVSNGHCEFNGVRSHAHIPETIPLNCTANQITPLLTKECISQVPETSVSSPFYKCLTHSFHTSWLTSSASRFFFHLLIFITHFAGWLCHPWPPFFIIHYL